MRLGLIATILSSIVGTAIFAIIAAKLGLDGKGTLSVPTDTWSRAAFYGVLALSLLAPVLSATQLFMDHPKQAARHTSSAASYYAQKDRLDAVLRRFDVIPLSREEVEFAERELSDISRTIEKVRAESISLTGKAKTDATQALR